MAKEESVPSTTQAFPRTQAFEQGLGASGKVYCYITQGGLRGNTKDSSSIPAGSQIERIL